ncbi:DUF5069 domain-containing protein [Nitrospira sp. Kam-Ns4a]
MDLRTAYPRSLREKLAGYVHLARMLDKARAALAGTLGEYIYPCPLDRRLLEFAGLTAEQFLEAVRGRSDEEVAAWFARTATPRSREEIEAWNEMMLAGGPDTEEKWAYFRSLRDKIDPTRTDLTTWADLLDLDEQRPVPIRSATMTGAR